MKKRVSIQSFPEVSMVGMTVISEGQDTEGPHIVLDDGIPEKTSKKDDVTEGDVYAKLVKIIVEDLRVGRNRVQKETELKSICIDSIDLVELLMAVEDGFEIVIKDDEANKICTVQDIFDCIIKK